MAWTYSNAYTQINDYSVKDGLTSGNSEKIILGADIDAELSGIATAYDSKLDAGSIASQIEAEGGTDPESVMTPLNTSQWANANGGHVGELWALADPAADRILGYDFSAGAGSMVAQLTATNGLEVSGTNLQLANSDMGTGLLITAGTLDVVGGFGITANADDIQLTDQAASTTCPVSLADGVLGLDITALTDFGTTAGADLDADTLVISDGPGTNKEILAAQLLTPEDFATEVGTSDILAETDFGKMIDYSSTSTTTITLPNSLKTGFWCVLRKTGATGNVTISATTTLQTANGLDTWATQYAAVTVMHIGSNVWVAWGALES
jgi:hypothetical protein